MDSTLDLLGCAHLLGDREHCSESFSQCLKVTPLSTDKQGDDVEDIEEVRVVERLQRQLVNLLILVSVTSEAGRLTDSRDEVSDLLLRLRDSEEDDSEKVRDEALSE